MLQLQSKRDQKMFIKGQIIGLHQNGVKVRCIEEITGQKNRMIRYVIKKFEDTGSVEREEGSGRPRKTSIQTDRRIVRMVVQDRFATARTIKQDLGLTNITEKTICNRITELTGYKSHWSARKPFINEANRLKRLEFAKQYVGMPPEFWDSVVFSDESKMEAISKGKERVWRMDGERFSTACTVATVKHEMYVMVWGCFCSRGVSYLRRIDGKMDRFVYLNILEDSLLPFLSTTFDHRNFIFQQDNDPKHTARVVTDWFVEHGMQVLKWPPQSPDLNPIENLWNILDVRLKMRRPANEDQLFKLLTDGWNGLEMGLLENLAHSMPRRLQKVIDNNGWQTSY